MLPGRSRNQSETGVAAKRPPSTSSKTPTETRARNARRRGSVMTPVASARSAALRGPSATRSGILSSVTARTSCVARNPLTSMNARSRALGSMSGKLIRRRWRRFRSCRRGLAHRFVDHLTVVPLRLNLEVLEHPAVFGVHLWAVRVLLVGCFAFEDDAHPDLVGIGRAPEDRVVNPSGRR